MKVKVGDKIYSSDDEPVMVILTDHDKFSIANMAPTATRYAEFPESWSGNVQRCLDWMGPRESGTGRFNSK